MTLMFILFFLILIGIGLTYSIRKTPYGLLTLRAAMIRRRFGDTPVTNPVTFRENMEISKRAMNRNPVPVEHVVDLKTRVNNIPLRLYHPAPQSVLPVIIYAHGGGWVGGSLNTHDNVCRRLAVSCQFAVLAVDYRLAPEHPFPAPVDDMLEVFAWLIKNGDHHNLSTETIVACGDSAGGNLAAVLTNLAREKFPDKIKAQILVYPITDATNTDTESYEHFSNGYRLSSELMEWFIDAYATPSQRQDTRCSPFLEKDLTGLPPTLIITAAFDPLRDEGEAYGEKLKEAGGIVKVSRYAGVLHGFFGNDSMGQEGLSAVHEVALFLKKHLK